MAKVKTKKKKKTEKRQMFARAKLSYVKSKKKKKDLHALNILKKEKKK
jgi:hypothetical protein